MPIRPEEMTAAFAGPPEDLLENFILFLELGVGYNTPVIIKYPFWRMTARNPDAAYSKPTF